MKPILFNTDMVKAILDGRKSVTRRVVPERILDKYDEYDDWCNAVMPQDIYGAREFEREFFIKNAPYRAGDILYVRETWSEWTDGYVYKAWTSPFPQAGRYPDKMMKWRPSIHMPKEAARIFLRVTDVQVERLRDIGDCTKEGVARGTHATAHMNAYDERCDFKALWNSTIKESDLDRYGWDANPWVWVIEFERISKEEAYDN